MIFIKIFKKKQELITEINTTSKTIESLVNEWNIQNLNTKKSNAKQNLNDFTTKHQKFFGLRDKE